MRHKGIWCVILTVCVLLFIQTAALAEDETEGTYAESIHWQVSGDGVLTIAPEEGQTEAVYMWGERAEDYPWAAHKDKIGTVTVGDLVSNVGNYAFQGFEKLKTVNLSAAVTTIGTGAFQGCEGLETLTLEAGLTTIGTSAFQGCTGLTAATLGPALEVVGASAFQNCGKLEELTLIGSLGTLDPAMLNGCTALKTVTLKGTEAAPLALADYTGGSAFRNTASLETLSFSGPFYNLGVKAFALYDEYGNAVDASGAFTGGDGLPTKLATVDMSGLKAGEGAALPEGLFMGCTALSEVKLPDKITSIGPRVFRGCTALKGITLPSAVAILWDGAFQNSGLETLTLPAGLTSIGASACEACASLAAVNFPAGLNYVGPGAFKNCSALTAMKFPRTATDFSMGEEAFSGCVSLASASLHMVRSAYFNLPDRAFQGCTTLASLELPDGLINIGESAFQACHTLQSVTLPKNMKTVGRRAFYECISLRHFDVMGSGVTLGEESFSNCTALTAAIIPEGVQIIGDYAFQNCGAIENAVIPSTAFTVAEQIFFSCTKLQHVYYPGTEAEWGNIINGGSLRDYLNRNYVNETATLVFDWDKETTPVTDGYVPGGGGSGGGDSSGGGSGGGDDAPVNPDDSTNAYGKNLPAKMTGATVTAAGVTVKVLGTPGTGAALFAVSYKADGSLMDTKTVAASTAGTYTAAVRTEGADYVYLFLLKSSAPVAEKYSLYLN